MDQENEPTTTFESIHNAYDALFRRIRLLSCALLFVALLAGVGLVAGTVTNMQRVNDIQQARRASIYYSCKQVNAEHLKTLMFLDTAQLAQLHQKPLLKSFPTIEAQTVQAIKQLPRKKRIAELRQHKLLIVFIDNLAPERDCVARANRTT